MEGGATGCLTPQKGKLQVIRFPEVCSSQQVSHLLRGQHNKPFLFTFLGTPCRVVEGKEVNWRYSQLWTHVDSQMCRNSEILLKVNLILKVA